MEGSQGEAGLGKDNQKLSVGHVKSEMPLRCSPGGGQQAIGSLHQVLGERSELPMEISTSSAERWLDKGWTRPSRRSSVAISFAGCEGQRMSHEKDFCKLLSAEHMEKTQSTNM